MMSSDKFPDNLIQTKFDEEKFNCPHCHFDIRIPIFRNNNLGIKEPITKSDVYSRALIGASEEIKMLCEVARDEHNRADNLLKIKDKYHTLLSQFAMSTANHQLLEVLEKFSKGDYR